VKTISLALKQAKTEGRFRQAWSELCQAQVKLGLANLDGVISLSITKTTF
jgi:hypothetical protein